MDLQWPGPSRVLSGPRALLGPLRVLIYSGRVPSGPPRVLIYSGRVPSGPPRVPSGPRSDWSGPTPRLGFTKILQSGRGVGGTLNTRAGCGKYLETLAGEAGLTL